MEDGCIIRDPIFCQTRVDIMHVDAPSSTMHRCTTKFQIDTRIGKAMVDGMQGSPFSMLNVINLELEGSMALRAASNAFHCVGHYYGEKFLWLGVPQQTARLQKSIFPNM